MTNTTEGTIDGLHELLAERSRYEGWLAQLEIRKATTPLHVLERVRADYASRLESVTTHLRGRATELEASAASLRSRLAALAGDEEARRDERAEVELRAAVGELAPEVAEGTMRECDTSIGSLMAQRDALGSELAKWQEVLVLVGRREGQVPVNPATATESIRADMGHATDLPDSALESIASLAPDPAPRSAANPEETTPSAVQELEFLRSVVSAPDAPGSQEGNGDLISQPMLSAPRRQATPMSTGTISGIRDPLRPAGGDDLLSAADMPAFLRDMPTEQVKTLKCQECGTMNFPTEWYCERCGGELAAM